MIISPTVLGNNDKDVHIMHSITNEKGFAICITDLEYSKCYDWIEFTDLDCLKSFAELVESAIHEVEKGEE